MNTKSSFRSSLLGIQGNLFSFAMKLTLDKDEAHDLVQDATLKALSNEEKYVENTNFKGWVMTIMRNIFINNYRRGAHELSGLDSSAQLMHLNLSQESTSSTPDGAYTIGEISSIIASFPEDYREPFSLHIAGYKYEEISEKLGMPLGTVKNKIFLTRKQLRSILKDYC